MALREGALGEVECFAQHVTADLVTQGNHGDVDGRGSLVDQTHIEAVKAFVGDECCCWEQNLREAMPSAFERSQGINYTRPRVLLLPLDHARARRASSGGRSYAPTP